MNPKVVTLCLFFVCLFALPIPDVSAGTTYKKYRDDKIQFEYPSAWKVVQEDGFLTFRDKKAKEQLYVQVLSVGFDEAAEEARFVRSEGKWMLLGRQDMEGDAEEISSNYWRGLIGETFVGVFGESGGMLGLGSATVAMISGGKTSVILSGVAMGSEEGDIILRSVRFLKK